MLIHHDVAGLWRHSNKHQKKEKTLLMQPLATFKFATTCVGDNSSRLAQSAHPLERAGK